MFLTSPYIDQAITRFDLETGILSEMGIFRQLANELSGRIALRCCLPEDRLVASGGVRLEPRHSPKRTAVRKIGKWRDMATLRF